MFGYVLPRKSELRVREWESYRAYYCGLCKELGREYGFLSRFVLNYDLVLLALTADSLAGECGKACGERCIANPLQKHPVCQSTPGLRLAADGLILTVYYKIWDDAADEHGAKRLAAKAALRAAERWRKKAAARHPELDEALRRETMRQAELESRGSAVTDEAADPTARMTQALFEAADPSAENRALGRFGYFLGKILYLLDAAEDYDEDAASGAYNVLIRAGLSREAAREHVQFVCRMCAGEASICYQELIWKAHKGILDNILYLGVPASIEHAGEKRPRKPERT